MCLGFVIVVVAFIGAVWIFDDYPKSFYSLVFTTLLLIVAFWVPTAIGNKLPYVETVTSRPIVSVYTDQSGNEIYLKAISGSKLVYRVMENDVPREKTISFSSIKEVVFDDDKPHLDMVKVSFKEWLYWLFAFPLKDGYSVFYVPKTGVVMDISTIVGK